MTDLPYSNRILELADKWIKGSITESEKNEFIDWYRRFDDHELLLTPEFKPLIKGLEADMLVNIRRRIAGDESPPIRTTPSEHKGRLVKIKTWQIAAAAILLLTASMLPFLLARKTRRENAVALQKPAPAPPPRTDILPGSNKAILTLANGSTITLDSAHNGNLTQQGNTLVVKSAGGSLRYNLLSKDQGKDQSNQQRSNAVAYNVLSTPRGGQYQLVLPDGSRVWLNAASSIRYPTAFAGANREVEVTGEAYFEIAKNAAMPFRVLTVNHLGDTDPMAVDVLGTDFNVNAYADESVARTTLVEGMVRVSKGNSKTLLQPGQQSELQKNGAITRVADADVEKAVAWRNGIFEFGDEELPVIMRQISRWYDVDVVYQGPVPTDRFTGRVTRNTSLSGVLKILKLSDVQFTVADNKIIVHS
ncbi:MAG TPA: FecR domain-containing protein [Puia sp.]|nr:FecR domain-containing protein [Puia sp.]